MNFTQFLRILRARYLIILMTFLLTVAASIIVSMLWHKTYKAATTLVLNYKGVDPVTGAAFPAQLVSSYVSTQVEIITSKNVALKVVDALKLAEVPVIKRDFYAATQGNGDIRNWLADLLLRNVEVIPSRSTSVVDIAFKGSDPVFVASVANAFAEAYQQTSVQLKVDPLKQTASYFNEQIKVLRANLEAAQQRLSKYQQEKGIVSVDNRLDVETARLNDLSSQLVLAQSQAAEASSRRRQALGNGIESPDVMANGLIQTLRSELARAESKFSETSEKLDKNHPEYQSSKAEVDKLRSSLNEQIALASRSVANNANILQQRAGELRAALSSQKAKVLELNRAHDELNLYLKEVESAQRAYETATQRLTQTSLEGQSNQSDVSVLNVATPPLAPSSPNLFVNVVLAAGLGLTLGLGLAMLAELINRRVRSERDITLLHVPVLGVVELSASTSQRPSLLALLGSSRTH